VVIVGCAEEGFASLMSAPNVPENGGMGTASLVLDIARIATGLGALTWHLDQPARTRRPHGASPWRADRGEIDQHMLALVRAARRHLPVAILSNTTSALPADLRLHGISGAFDAVFTSAELGVAKPAPAPTGPSPRR
jgi:beta-phosphoglucomutase-like phosphatase (HAD superfamily)